MKKAIIVIPTRGLDVPTNLVDTLCTETLTWIDLQRPAGTCRDLQGQLSAVSRSENLAFPLAAHGPSTFTSERPESAPCAIQGHRHRQGTGPISVDLLIAAITNDHGAPIQSRSRSYATPDSAETDAGVGRWQVCSMANSNHHQLSTMFFSFMVMYSKSNI